MFIDKLQAYIDELLEVNNFKDASFNGLQVEGKQVINKVITASTASLASINFAIEQQADVLLVHHGLMWKGDNPCITGVYKKRLKALMDHDINLLAYHLPLDANKALGNNSYLCSVIDGVNTDYINSNDASSIAMTTHLKEVKSAQDLALTLAKALNCKVEIINNKDKLQDIAVCSGSGSFLLDNVKSFTYDALITGDVNEQTYHLAYENNITVLALGHASSEQDGIRLLGNKLKTDLNLQVIHFQEQKELLSTFVVKDSQ